MSDKRTFGWIQNLGDLKKVVAVFQHGSTENL